MTDLINSNVKEILKLGIQKQKEKNFANIKLKYALSYAAEDSDVTLSLWYLLKRKLVDQGLFSFYFYNERPLINIIKKMEMEGVKIDFEFLQELSNNFEMELSKLEKNIFEI